MPSDRRFSEREIREVFERAAAQQQAAHQEPDGLTLEEMQEVAASAGIDPRFVANAAQAVALGEPETGRTTLGPIPTGVYRTELLPGPATDDLWTAILSDARSTFNAQGTENADGRVREWHNGNLRVTLEPAGAGSRLSLRTRRDSSASGVASMGIVMAFGVIATCLSLFAYGDAHTAQGWMWMIFGGAVGMLMSGLGQRKWAATREDQMEALAARAHRRSADGAPPLATPALEIAPLLDLDALGDAAADPAAASRARDRA